MSKTYKTLLSEQQRLKRLERSLALERDKARKQDTRHKIQLGGLIIKAGLGHLGKHEILGLLTEAKERINERGENHIRTWADKGQRAFYKKS